MSVWTWTQSAFGKQLQRRRAGEMIGAAQRMFETSVQSKITEMHALRFTTGRKTNGVDARVR